MHLEPEKRFRDFCFCAGSRGEQDGRQLMRERCIALVGLTCVHVFSSLL